MGTYILTVNDLILTKSIRNIHRIDFERTDFRKRAYSRTRDLSPLEQENIFQARSSGLQYYNL